MTDKFEQLIKNLPETSMKKSGADRTTNKIVRHYLVNFWKKRISIVSGIGSIIFGVLMIKRIIELADLLDTAGFWNLIGTNWQWIVTDFPAVWSAFSEAHPLKEIGTLLVLIFLFGASLFVLLKKEEW